MITDEIKRRAFAAAAPFFDDGEGDHFDAVLVALEAVAPMLIEGVLKEIRALKIGKEDNDWNNVLDLAENNILACAQELDPK